MKQDTFLLRTRFGLLTVIFTATQEGLKKPLKQCFILTRRVGLKESKSLKHECKLLKTITADQKQSPTMREKHLIDRMTMRIEMHQ